MKREKARGKSAIGITVISGRNHRNTQLEQYTSGRALITTETSSEGDEGYHTTDHLNPKLDYSAVAGDRRALPPRIMYKLRELPALQAEVER
ncbi:hypothetical protein SJI19_05710 [Acerihabitans sp. TG2]|uniref:hypothetical protein n=1 Tax=Acerihabitans sp. TG2 TaxID=3096008 RepID=UPI002B236FF5|nr:hypothetical protein [Acerihabitans sp. TG2]MEA9390051.1 hypothetical protein [Acerihabitans sp. TG2]